MIMYLAEIGVYERKSTIPILSNLLVEAGPTRTHG